MREHRQRLPALQWSHVLRGSGNMAALVPMVRLDLRLQWSHAHERGNPRPSCDGSAALDIASMEPRSIERGNGLEVVSEFDDDAESFNGATLN